MISELPPFPAEFQADIEHAVRLLKEGGCSEVYLFGSAAKGRLGQESDIDLAVTGCPRGTFFRLMGKLMLELKTPVDLVDLDSKDPFARYLQQRGELVRIG